MDEAAIPHAVELLVGLLGLAVFVAIIARPLRVPYTVALVVAGLLVGIGASAVGYPTVDVSPELVLLVLLPGLVFEAAYRLRIRQLRRWFRGLVLLAVPGVLVSAAVVAVAAEPRHGAAARPRVHRRRDGLGDRSGSRGGDVQTPAGARGPVDHGRR